MIKSIQDALGNVAPVIKAVTGFLAVAGTIYFAITGNVAGATALGLVAAHSLTSSAQDSVAKSK